MRGRCRARLSRYDLRALRTRGIDATLSGLSRTLGVCIVRMFQDGTVEGLFNGHFPGVQKSDHLKTLFAINSVPTGAAAISASEGTEISGRR